MQHLRDLKLETSLFVGICRYLSFYEQLNFRAQLSMKKFYNLGPDLRP